MDKAGFTSQIEKHETRIKKNTTLSRAATIAKLLLALATASFISMTIYRTLTAGPSIKSAMPALISAAALFAAHLYHSKLKEKIKHSYEMISINKRHIDRITDIETAADLPQPLTSDEIYEDEKQQTPTTATSRETCFADYYANAMKKAEASGFGTKPALTPNISQAYAKATSTRFLFM